VLFREDEVVAKAGILPVKVANLERLRVAAAEAGADFGLLLSPSYFRKQMTDEVLFRYFTTTADGSPIPLLAYNAPAVGGKIQAIFGAMGFGAGDGFAGLGALLAQIGISTRLGDLGFQESHMETIVTETLSSAQRPTNPRDPTREDIEAIVRRLM